MYHGAGLRDLFAIIMFGSSSLIHTTLTHALSQALRLCGASYADRRVPLLQEQDLPEAPSARPGQAMPAHGEDEFGLPAVPQRT